MLKLKNVFMFCEGLSVDVVIFASPLPNPVRDHLHCLRLHLFVLWLSILQVRQTGGQGPTPRSIVYQINVSMFGCWDRPQQPNIDMLFWRPTSRLNFHILSGGVIGRSSLDRNFNFKSLFCFMKMLKCSLFERLRTRVRFPGQMIFRVPYR